MIFWSSTQTGDFINGVFERKPTGEHGHVPEDTMAGWWFGTFFIFSYIVKIIIPTDEHIFQRGRYTTNPTNQIIINHH